MITIGATFILQNFLVDVDVFVICVVGVGVVVVDDDVVVAAFVVVVVVVTVVDGLLTFLL